MVNQEKHGKLRKCLDTLSLLAVLQYCVFRFLQSTTFPFVYCDTYKIITIIALVSIGTVRFFYIAYYKVNDTVEKRTRNKQIYTYTFLAALAIPFIYVGLKNDLKILVFMPITALCLYDMNAEKVIKYYIVTIGLLLMTTILCCLAGSIRNIAVVDYMGDYEYKASYGICNTTDFAAYFLFLLIFVWCLQKEGERPWISAVAIVVALGTYYLSGSRTTLVCCIIFIVFSIWLWLEKKATKANNTHKCVSNISNCISIAAFPLMALIGIGIIFAYGRGYEWARVLDSVFSGRIESTYLVFKKYGIQFLGSVFEMHGNGGSILLDWREGSYDFLDSSYAYILIRYGLLIFCIFCGVWIWTTVKAIKNGKKQIAFAMMIMAVYALSESHLHEINYNILVTMPLCAFEKESNDDSVKTLDIRRQRKIYPFLFAFYLIIFALLPRFLSWFRTIVYLKHWNSGILTIWPLLYSIVFTSALGLFGKLLIKTISRKKRGIGFLLLCVLSLFICKISGDNIIQQGKFEQAEIINNDERMIQLVLESAKQPVYVAERSELYKNVGFTYSMMTPEDLSRRKQGTVFVDKNREVLPIMISGCKYLQFSESSGLYSFDPDVISMLSDKGYEWKRFYDSDRSCDLVDLAYLNDLEINAQGSIVLQGSEKSIKNNRFLDQEIGTYAVEYKLHRELLDVNWDSKELVCTILVTGHKGESIIYEKKVYNLDFDEFGYCSVSIEYFTSTIPRVEFKIIAEEFNTLYIDEITWKRISKGVS